MSTLKEPSIDYLKGLKNKNKYLICQLEDNVLKYDEIMIFINENCDYTYNTVDLINYYNKFCEQAKEEIKKIKNINRNIDEKIDKVCEHIFVTDIIDIAPDREQTICYCKICELNK
jgi:hypothetical protein